MQHSASTSASQPSILRNKRTRIGETSIIQPKSNSDKDRLLATFESGCLNLHEAARDSEQTVRFKNDFIKDLLKFQKQKERSNRLLEDNFIPKNIALKVALTGTSEISNTDEFKSIQGRASIALQEYQKKMKELMVETATLEIETTMKSQQETVYNFTRELFLDSLLLEGASEDTDDDNRMESLAEVMTEAVLDDESFSKIYFGRVKSFERQDGTSEKIASYRAAIERNQSCVNDVKKQMHKILVATVELHQEIILNQLTHDAIAKRRSKTQAAADVNNIQMNVDQAMASMDVDTMNDLVDRRIMEIEKAKERKSKNSKRGATKKSSASSKKKKKKNEQQKMDKGTKAKTPKETVETKVKEKQAYWSKLRNIERKERTRILNKFKFLYSYSDSFLSPNQFRMGYIVQQILQNIPLDSLLYSPRHFSYHDLRSNKNKPIPALRSLLGLGLNFCLHPSQQTRIDETGLETLKKDFCTRLMFAGKEEDAEEAPDLYIKSKDWEPPDAPAPCMQRLMNFEMELRRNFATPRRHKNAPIQLLAHQLDALTWLKEHPEIVVLHTDKNLGPAIMDRERYLDLAWRDHLSDRYTYQRLTQEEAKTLQNEAIEKLHYFIRNPDTKIGFDNTNFIKRMLQYNFTDSDSDDRGFSWMYLLAKIHKPKLKTRAIISYSGSLLEGLGRWVDKELKKITARLPYIAKDSKSIVVDLRAKRWPAATSIFTMDAVSMYTNIHLGHALPIIMKFLTSHPKGLAIKKAANISVSALEHALELIMSYNLFKFGDCYFLQLAGTAMGAPCAPEWATLYYCIFELDIIPLFPELGFYKRYRR